MCRMKLLTLALLTLTLAACGTAPQAVAPTATSATLGGASTAAPAATAIPTTAQPVTQPTLALSPTPEETTMPDDTATPVPATSVPSASPSRATRTAPVIQQVPTVATPSDAVVGEVPADLLNKILADAAQRSGVAAESIIVQQGQAVEWSDSSLGCGKPGVAYLQVITSGYQVMLQAGESTYDYRATSNGRFILCQK